MPGESPTLFSVYLLLVLWSFSLQLIPIFFLFASYNNFPHFILLSIDPRSLKQDFNQTSTAKVLTARSQKKEKSRFHRKLKISKNSSLKMQELFKRLTFSQSILFTINRKIAPSENTKKIKACSSPLFSIFETKLFIGKLVLLYKSFAL